MSESSANGLSGFIKAVKAHWVALMSGGVITVAVALFERWSARNVPGWVYGGILIGFLFWACYLAWRDERRQRLKAESDVKAAREEIAQLEAMRKPELQLTIEQLVIGVATTSEDDTGIVFYISVKNVGVMPSVVDDYGLTFTFPDGQQVQAEGILVPDAVTLHTAKGAGARMDRTNALYEKTLRPIPSGGMERGFLVFIVRGIRESEFHNAEFTLLWRDVTGQVNKNVGVIGGEGRPGIPVMPGISYEPARAKQRSKKKSKRG